MPYKNIDDRRKSHREYRKRRRKAGLEPPRPPHSAKDKEVDKRWREANRERINQWSKEWRAKNPEARKRIELRAKLKKLGITLEEYDAIYLKQQGKCAICDSESNGLKGERLAIDHCHRTRKVRGLLCGHCNAALGMIDDDIELLTRMISYLRAYATPQTLQD